MAKGGRGGRRGGGAGGIKAPTTEELVSVIRGMNRQEVNEAHNRIMDDGSWYSEDKRRKREDLIEIVKGNYDPDGDGMYSNEGSRQILWGVFGIMPYSGSNEKAYAEARKLLKSRRKK